MSAETTPLKIEPTKLLLNVLMGEYAIAGNKECILAQDLSSCSEICFAGQKEHAVLHYPARLLVQSIANSRFSGTREWYRTHDIPSCFEIDTCLAKILQVIKDRVNPIKIAFYTPRIEHDEEASDIDADLIKLVINRMFTGIECQRLKTPEAFISFHNPKM